MIFGIILIFAAFSQYFSQFLLHPYSALFNEETCYKFGSVYVSIKIKKKRKERRKNKKHEWEVLDRYDAVTITEHLVELNKSAKTVPWQWNIAHRLDC